MISDNDYFSSKYYQVRIATHLPTLEGWKAEHQKFSWRLLLESSPGGTRTCDLWVTSLKPYHYATHWATLLHVLLMLQTNYYNSLQLLLEDIYWHSIINNHAITDTSDIIWQKQKKYVSNKTAKLVSYCYKQILT